MKSRLAVLAGGLLAVVLCSCQGRTRENMVPLGETVEVEISVDVPDELPADSASDYQQ